MSQPKVSLILPTYNRSTKCISTITDIINQIHQNWELVIVNDCSVQPNTMNIENHILKIKDDRIKYLYNKPNMGISKSINKGILHATGEYITWISDDNKLYPEFISTLISPKADFSYAAYYVTTNLLSTKKRYVLPNYKSISDVLYNFRGMAAFMWKKSVFDKIGKFNESLSGYCEDWDMEIRTFLLTDNIVRIDKAIEDYYNGSDTLSVQRTTQIAQKTSIVRGFYTFYLHNIDTHDKISIVSDIKNINKENKTIKNIVLTTNKNELIEIDNVVYMDKFYLEFLMNMINSKGKQVI